MCVWEGGEKQILERFHVFKKKLVGKGGGGGLP